MPHVKIVIFFFGAACNNRRCARKAKEPANPAVNPGFETANASGWTTSGTVSASYGGHSGHYAGKLTGLASIGQNIGGLAPNTACKVQARLKSDVRLAPEIALPA